MPRNNTLWGAERIPGALIKLEIRVSKRTIRKCNFKKGRVNLIYRFDFEDVPGAISPLCEP